MVCKGFSFLFVSLLCLHASSQKPIQAGLNVNGEIYPDEFNPNFGLILEKQLTKRSGTETGILYRTEKSDLIITYANPSGSYSYSVSIAQRHLNVPVLYKYYSKIFNFLAGPTLDFYAGWKQNGDDAPVRIESFDVHPKVKAGFLIKVSKAFPLKKQLLLEPELRFGSVGRLEAAFGIGISGKYRF